MSTTANFTVTLTPASTVTVTVHYATQDGTAVAGTNYTATSGTLTFAPGETTKQIPVVIADIGSSQPTEAFTIVLSSPTNATISKSTGTCSITGNDTTPVITVWGPLIKKGLITNAYQFAAGRGDYFHANSGTTEGQFIMIDAAYLAYTTLQSQVDTASQNASAFYTQLAAQMLDAMGNGTTSTPMLRQAIPSSADTITLLHWLFAAKGDIPLQAYVLDYQATINNGVLKIPSSDATSHAADVFRVWQIYPAASALLYGSPFSPVVGGGGIAIDSTMWTIDTGNNVVITPPAGTAPGTYKIVYGYNNAGTLTQGSAYEAYPVWTAIADGYAACAPDTFRWFDQAINNAIAYDTRTGNATKWTQLRDAMRKTSVRGQNLNDLRQVFQPLPGIGVFDTTGRSGMFCYSNRTGALPPADQSLNQAWTGYNFFSLDTTSPAGAGLGDIVVNVNTTASAPGQQVQIGRGLSDSWRSQILAADGTSVIQQPDQYLYVECSCSVVPTGSEVFEVFVSSTRDFNVATRWFCNIGAYVNFVATNTASGAIIKFLVPQSDLKNKLSTNTPIPLNTPILNFGFNSEIVAPHTFRIRTMRLVSGPSQAWVQSNIVKAAGGYGQLPYFPGAMPFAVNADLVHQQFVGYNGNPFHGYQQPDFWLDRAQEAVAVHGTLTAADLPCAQITAHGASLGGGLTYPISLTNANGTTKPTNILLMEQQLRFLKDAQTAYNTHGGTLGPFAHTFVLNTPARDNIGDPPINTWVYTNDDPNTKWLGYQCRVVESLCAAVYRTYSTTQSTNTAQDVYTLALSIAMNWLNWLNAYWPNLNGISYNDPVLGTILLKGMPTEYPDPTVSAPTTSYDEPHGPALILRACMWLKLINIDSATNSLCDALMLRCWQYMETLWQTSGDMQYTWSPIPSQHNWYGFWHAEIITTISRLATVGASILPSGIDLATLRQRLVLTEGWLATTGVVNT